MKQLTQTLAFLTLAFLLTGCGDNNSSAPAGSTAEQTTTSRHPAFTHVEEMKAAAAKGDVDAKMALENMSKAEQGDATAQYYVAMAYRGNPSYQDLAQSFHWFSEAAKQGQRDSQFFLGVMYQNGESLAAPDNAKAIEWLTKAADQGDGSAKARLKAAKK